LKKQRQDLTGLTPILKEFLLWVKCYQGASHATEKSFVKGRVNRFGKFHCCLKGKGKALPVAGYEGP
jgi:hypothetical protein